MQLATFVLDGQRLGIDVVQVQEVLRAPRTTPVPLAPREVEGLLNLRGQIVPVLDLRRRLGLPDRPSGAPEPMSVVVRTTEGPVSLLVDAVGDVVAVDVDALEPTPETVADAARSLLLGAHLLADGLLLVLDAVAAVDVAA